MNILNTNYLGYNLLLFCVVYFILRFLVLKSLIYFFGKTKNNFDDILLKNGFFNQISHLPLLIIVSNIFETHESTLSIYIYKFLLILITITIIISIIRLIDSFVDIFLTQKNNNLNLKSYVQLLKLILYLSCFIVIVSILLNKSPIYLLSSLGALTAVIMILFKDTILSLVSSVLITSNNLFKVGDWLEIPQFNTDGEVIDIALHNIKIQNWDKTISVIPTNKLIESSFKNWKGMSESGGRRIKRSINIDMNSVVFCNSDMLDSFKKFHLLSDYIEKKINEIHNYNKQRKLIDTDEKNARHLTNIGIFRIYLENYLKENPSISKNMTFLVRQLSPTSEGVPIEIYVFSNDTNWSNYEKIQSDIFDHILAVVPKFNLKIYQKPSGDDFLKLKEL